MIDLHVHSEFSIDCLEPMENYIKLNPSNSFVFTEHVDLVDFYTNKETIFDIKSYKKKLKKLNKTTKVYSGVELGFHTLKADKIKQFIIDNQFDIVLLSFHCGEKYDYLAAPENWIVDLDYYFKSIQVGLEYITPTIVSHLDFPFRLNALPDNFFAHPELIKTLQLIITKEVAIEINTRSVFDYNNYDFYKNLLDVYTSLGGRKISIGSDAHAIEKYMFCFEEIQETLLKDYDLEIINHNY